MQRCATNYRHPREKRLTEYNKGRRTVTIVAWLGVAAASWIGGAHAQGDASARR
ncbi:hypothetical protein KQH60_02755 [Mycetohabitans sp. B8]|uniref:hypothetical protein n=1 Tax=Mycetohabitans sp. B8 TaxID=2841845 RepID=UPI001F3A2BD0|nr:hypothetical protein [Mycetohabitans sp. B8]MCG1041549.1 hypothetical protein [Mycetohabitans sp. B8]